MCAAELVTLNMRELDRLRGCRNDQPPVSNPGYSVIPPSMKSVVPTM
jgi:hypothetical protein